MFTKLLTAAIAIAGMLTGLWLVFDYFWINYQMTVGEYFWLRWPWMLSGYAMTFTAGLILNIQDKRRRW